MKQTNRIRLVEAARGLAALQVLLYHIVEINQLAVPDSAIAYLMVPFSFGREAVIVFFVLSGFSIHYASQRRDLASASGIGRFMLRRAIRLYPILLAAIALTMALIALGDMGGLPAYRGLWSAQSVNSAVMSVAFLTDLTTTAGHWFATPPTNPSLWSLSYEAIYYLLYPLFWLLVRRHGICVAVFLGVGVSALAYIAGAVYAPSHLFNVLQLYAVWCLGAGLAHCKRNGLIIHLAPAYVFAAPILLLLLRSVFRDVIPIVFGDWMLALAVSIACLALLGPHYARTGGRTPDLALLVAAVAGSVFASWWIVDVGLYRGSALLLAVKVAMGVSLLLVVTSHRRADWLLSVCTRTLLRFECLGGVSYAIYVFHYPLLKASRSWFEPSVGLPLSVLVGVLAIGALAFVFERRIQPRLVSLLIKP